MFNVNKELLETVENFVKKEFVPGSENNIHYFGCMDCSNSCAENCASKCKKNSKK